MNLPEKNTPNSPRELMRLISDKIQMDPEVSQVFYGTGLGETTRKNQLLECVQLYLAVTLTEEQNDRLPTDLFGIPIEYISVGVISALSVSEDTSEQDHLIQSVAQLLLATGNKN